MISKEKKCLNGSEDVEVIEEVEVSHGEIFPVIDFPIEVFPEDLQRVAHSFSRAFRVPVSAILSGMLTLLSVALGNTVRVSPKEGWHVPLFIWLVIIGRSGSGKSPFVSKLTEPISKKEAIEAKKYNDAMREYEKAIAIKKGIDKPERVSYLATDATVEALAEVMKDSPRGVLMNQDEFSGFMLGLGQYKRGGNDVQQYLEIFNCKPVHIKRKKVYIDAPNTGCAIIGGIQPKILPKIFKDTEFDIGLVPRIIFSDMGDYWVKHTDYSVSNEDMRIWYGYIARAYDNKLSLDSNDICEYKIINFTKEARKRFIQFQNEYEQKKHIEGGAMEVFVPKLFDYCSKFSGLLSFLRDEKDVGINTLEDGIKITDYYAGQARQMISQYGKSESLNCIQKRILDCLYALSGKVKNGMLAISKIVEMYNLDEEEGFKLNSKGASSIVKKHFKLETEPYGSGGRYHLIWNKERMSELFNLYRITSTTSTFST